MILVTQLKTLKKCVCTIIFGTDWLSSNERSHEW